MDDFLDSESEYCDDEVEERKRQRSLDRSPVFDRGRTQYRRSEYAPLDFND